MICHLSYRILHQLLLLCCMCISFKPCDGSSRPVFLWAGNFLCLLQAKASVGEGFFSHKRNILNTVQLPFFFLNVSFSFISLKSHYASQMQLTFHNITWPLSLLLLYGILISFLEGNSSFSQVLFSHLCLTGYKDNFHVNVSKWESEWIQVCGGSSISSDFFAGLEQVTEMWNGDST